MCYTIFYMTKTDVKAVLDRVLSWPAERQADVAHLVELLEQQDRSTLHLTEAQAEEVRRRLADPNPKTVSFEKAFRRFRTSKA
jgi:hypothetical protein